MEHHTRASDPEEARTPPGSAAPTVHVGIVHAAGEICHVAAATSRSGLDHALALHIRDHAWYQLGPEDGVRVLDLIDAGRWNAAVTTYFARVGERWDPERLDVREIPLDGRAVDLTASRATNG